MKYWCLLVFTERREKIFPSKKKFISLLLYLCVNVGKKERKFASPNTKRGEKIASLHTKKGEKIASLHTIHTVKRYTQQPLLQVSFYCVPTTITLVATHWNDHRCAHWAHAQIHIQKQDVTKNFRKVYYSTSAAEIEEKKINMQIIVNSQLNPRRITANTRYCSWKFAKRMS